MISTDRVRSLISRRSKEGEKLPPGEAEKVAREARADLFLNGTLLKVGPQLHLDLRVQETNTGKVLFADKVDGETAQAVFDMANQMTSGIVEQVLPGETHSKFDVAASLTSNLEALHAYQEGRDDFVRWRGPEAVESFRRATELDPQFALAHYYLSSMLYWMDIPTARRAINRATQLSECLPRQQRLLIQELHNFGSRGAYRKPRRLHRRRYASFPSKLNRARNLPGSG